MEHNFEIMGLAALFWAMVVLAAVPSVSVFAVVSRSISSGFRHGVYTTLGILAGDIVYILVALYGLSLLSETMGPFFVVLKYMGGCYLLVFGVMQWRAATSALDRSETQQRFQGWSSFMAGLSITLGDQKAILFYLGFLPAFVNVKIVTWFDTMVIVMVAAVSLILVKLSYAALAHRVRLRAGSKWGEVVGKVAAVTLVGAGVFILLRGG